MIVNEPVNEKGLTRQQYKERMETRSKNIARGAVLSMALSMGNIIYQTGRAIIDKPIQPAGYQTYVDAGTTLSTLRQRIISLQDISPNLPYAPDSLQEQLEGAFNEARQVTKLDDITKIVERDMAQMREEHPEYAVYDNKLASIRQNFSNYGTSVSMAILGLGGALSIGIPAFAARRKRIGSNVWHEEQGAESR